MKTCDNLNNVRLQDNVKLKSPLRKFRVEDGLSKIVKDGNIYICY